MKRQLAVTFLALAALVAGACGGAAGPAGAKPTVIVGSTNFYEQVILGELYAQVLEADGYTVERRFNLGNREIVQPALQSGQIDLLAEYLATLVVFLDSEAEPTTDKTETAEVLQGLLEPIGLTLLEPADATDQNGIVVTKETADRLGLSKVSDLEPVAGDLVFGAPPECPEREFCAIGLRDKYGITFKEFRPLDAGGPLTVAALEGNQIDVALLFTSDPSIVAKGFVLLEDDKQLQLADNIAPVVRTELLDEDPGEGIEALLNSVSAKLSQDELNGLNTEVAVEQKDPADVAAAWLKKQGLVN
ncbi:MAG: ABC transporter substrate-binding protein [Candidatus Limnocylindria bacterium]